MGAKVGAGKTGTGNESGRFYAIQLETANLQQQYQFIQENIKRVSEEIRTFKRAAGNIPEGTRKIHKRS